MAVGLRRRFDGSIGSRRIHGSAGRAEAVGSGSGESASSADWRTLLVPLDVLPKGRKGPFSLSAAAGQPRPASLAAFTGLLLLLFYFLAFCLCLRQFGPYDSTGFVAASYAGALIGRVLALYCDPDDE